MEEKIDDLTIPEQEEGQIVTLFKGRVTLKKQDVPRFWRLGISSIMLLTFVLPFLSWGNYRWNASILNEENASISGFYYLIRLLDLEVGELPFAGQLIFFIMLLVLVGTLVISVLLILNGVKLWKPKNDKIIRILSMCLALLFGLSLLKEFIRVIYIMIGDPLDRMFLVSESIEWDPAVMMNMEQLGIGYWFCMIGAILLFRSTYGDFWKTKKRAEWGRKSFVFWAPFVILLFLVHHNSGLIRISLDIDTSSSEYRFIKEMKKEGNTEFNTTYTTSGLALMRGGAATLYVANEYDEDSFIGKLLRSYLKISVVLFVLFGLVFVQFFVKNLNKRSRLIISSIQLLLVVLLFFFVQGLISYFKEFYFTNDSYSVMAGVGMYLILIAAVLSIGEQIYFWKKTSEISE